MARAVTKPSSPRFKVIKETIAELRKVVWLSRREATYLSLLVILLSLAMGLFLGAVDYGFTTLISKLFLGR